MATNVNVPVALPEDSNDYLSQWGSGTATVYLEYGTATVPADGTATTLVAADTEHYEFWVEADPTYYFRFRVGDGTDFTPYSSVFQLNQTYCTVDEVVRGLDFPDESRYAELEALCREATDFITHKICGHRSFFREPLYSGETTLTLDVELSGQARLSLARGHQLDIVSLSSVKVTDYTGGTQTELTEGATGYYTMPDKAPTGQPYTDLVLSDQGTVYTTFPTGRRVVELTGVFGWSAVPDLVRRAAVDLVRYWWNQRSSDEPVGVSAFGQPVWGPGLPKTVRELFRSDYAWHEWMA